MHRCTTASGLTYFTETYQSWGVALDFTHYKIYARTGDTAEVQGCWNSAPVDESAPVDALVQSFSVSLQPYAGIGPIYYIDHPKTQ